ncbi:hypothetical protein KXD93_10040 [Mucilaginibacter sp. BJC16-A38]|uniref:hypothetical protein n=1 Tax=Mucilaginibacter phenanthrenivorans TaxID=1234842 RepID=UPI00215779D5|nr:hypothetical protein [Mucilaginibacter phenanthrenivorans]MCR8557984.1 hypothetical protein [Mucilaginibacter phenanthrenivorans]
MKRKIYYHKDRAAPVLFGTKARLKRIPYYYLAVLIFTVSPIILSTIGSLIGNSLGCNINEAGTDTCVRYGIQLGETLSTLFTCFWLLFFTVPFGFIALLVLIYAIDRDKKYHSEGND